MQEVGVLWSDTRFGTVDDENFQLGDYIYKKRWILHLSRWTKNVTRYADRY